MLGLGWQGALCHQLAIKESEIPKASELQVVVTGSEDHGVIVPKPYSNTRNDGRMPQGHLPKVESTCRNSAASHKRGL